MNIYKKVDTDCIAGREDMADSATTTTRLRLQTVCSRDLQRKPSGNFGSSTVEKTAGKKEVSR